MKKRILLGTVALAAMSTSVLAADLPSRRAPPVYVPPIPVFSWTGFYVGGQVGYGFGRDNIAVTAPAATGLSGATVVNPHGIVGGGHIGYNLATPSLGGLGGLGGIGGGGLVIGVEADIDGSDYQGTVANAGVSTTLRNDIQGSARGRVGIAVDRALFYATGGAAFAEFRTSYSGGGLPNITSSTTKVGWTAGGGVEYAITTQWSLRAEYRYSDFDRFHDQPVADLGVNRKEILQRAQVGFSYKFDSPAALPVVARY